MDYIPWAYTHGCVNAGLEIDGAQGDASETRAGAFGEGFKDQKKRKKRDTTKNWLITTGLGRNSLQEIKNKNEEKSYWAGTTTWAGEAIWPPGNGFGGLQTNKKKSKKKAHGSIGLTAH